MKREHIAVTEAQKLNIPVFALVDTNSDPSGVDFPIPSNDDAFKSISILTKHIGKVIEEARSLGCTYLFLESNQRLTPALNIYKSLGFVEVPIGETPYARADFKAEMYL